MKFIFTTLATLSLFSSVYAEQETTKMTEEMRTSNKALKKLRKIDKSDWDGMAAAAREAQAAFLKSMSYVPVVVKEMQDGPEKDKAAADARRLLGLGYAALCELEMAYLEKDQDMVDAALSKIKEVRKEGHDSYTDD